MGAGRLLASYRRFVLDTTNGRRKLLSLEMARYFGKMNPALTARSGDSPRQLATIGSTRTGGEFASLKKMIVQAH